MHITITALRFDGNGSGEKTTTEHTGRLETVGEQVMLVFGTAGETTLTTTLSFSRTTPDEVEMVQTGDGETRMRFAPGKPFEGEYRVPGAGSFSLRVTANRVDNRLLQDGHLLLDYEMLLGGARQRNILKIACR